jgi:hypothetical protein
LLAGKTANWNINRHLAQEEQSDHGAVRNLIDEVTLLYPTARLEQAADPLTRLPLLLAIDNP